MRESQVPRGPLPEQLAPRSNLGETFPGPSVLPQLQVAQPRVQEIIVGIGILPQPRLKRMESLPVVLLVKVNASRAGARFRIAHHQVRLGTVILREQVRRVAFPLPHSANSSATRRGSCVRAGSSQCGPAGLWSVPCVEAVTVTIHPGSCGCPALFRAISSGSWLFCS